MGLLQRISRSSRPIYESIEDAGITAGLSLWCYPTRQVLPASASPPNGCLVAADSLLGAISRRAGRNCQGITTDPHQGWSSSASGAEDICIQYFKGHTKPALHVLHSSLQVSNAWTAMAQACIHGSAPCTSILKCRALMNGQQCTC